MKDLYILIFILFTIVGALDVLTIVNNIKERNKEYESRCIDWKTNKRS